MADSVGSVSLKMILDSKEFKAQVNKEVKGSLSQIDASQRKITSSAKSATSFLGKEISSLSKLGSIAKGLIATLGVGLSVAGIVNFAKSCTSLGSDLTEVQNVVDVVFGDMNASVNEFASNAIKTYGMSETKAKEYMGTLGAMSKAFGNSQSEAYAQAETLTKMAGDMASFYNKSTDETFTALKAVYSGETEVLKQYGVVMTETALNEYAMQQGIGKTVKQMSEQEKVALRLSFVQDKLSDSAGDFSRTSGSWANQVRVLSLQFESFKASIGQGLINVLTPVVQWLNSIMEAANGAAQAFAQFTATISGVAGSGSAVSGMGAIAESTANAAESAEAVNDGVAAAGGSAKKASKQLAGFDKLNVLNKNSGGGGGGGGATKKAVTTSAATSENVPSVSEKIKAAFDLDPRSLGTTVGTKIKSAMDMIPWGDIQNKVNGGMSKVSQFINGFFQTPGLFASAGRGMAEGLNTITGAIDTFFNETEFFENAKSIGEGFEAFITTIDFKKNASSLSGAIKSLPDTIAGFLAGVKWDKVGSSLYNGVKDFFKNFKFKDISKSLGRLAGEINKAISKFIIGIGSELIADIKDYFATHSIWEVIQDVLGILTGSKLLVWVSKNIIGPFFEGLAETLGIPADVVSSVQENLSFLLKSPFEIALEKIKELFGKLSDWFLNLRNKIEQIWSAVAVWFNTTVVQPLINFFKPIVEKITGFFKNIWLIVVGIWAVASDWFNKNVVQPVIGYFKTVWENVSGFFKSLWDDIVAIWTLVSTWFNTNVIEPVTGFFKSVWETVSGYFSSLWNDITAVWTSVSTWFSKNVTEPIKGFFKSIWEDVSGFFSSLWNDICEVWKTASSWFTEHVTGPIADAFGGITGSVKDAFNSVIGTIESAINSILKGINSFASKLDIFGKAGAAITGEQYTGFSQLGTVTLPRLANGAFVEANTPQLALIGDNRHQGEFVAPEDKLTAAVTAAMTTVMNRYMSAMQTRMALSGSGGDININLQAMVDDEVLFEAVEKVRARRQKRSGGNL